MNQEDASMSLPPTPCSARVWCCYQCGHTFAESEAQGVDIAPCDPDCDERVIACPKCYANCLDDDHALTEQVVELRICTDCEIPHFENCPLCFGFGIRADISGRVAVAAGEASRSVKFKPCPACRSTPKGVPSEPNVRGEARWGKHE